MKLVVHQLDFSPYCIPITAALDAFGVAYHTDEISYGDRTKIIRLTRGRYYQVPVLEHGGKVIFETGPDTIDVARYVDRTWAGGRLFPPEKEGLQRILVSHIENEIEGTTFKLMDPHRIDAIRDLVTRVEHIRYKERRFGRGCLEQWKREVPALRRRTEALLEPFDLMVRHTPFLLGDAPVYADYALFGIAENLTYGGYAKLPGRLVALARWQRRLKAWRFA